MIGMLKSMGTTLATTMRRPVTTQYPEVHRPIPERERGFPLLLWDEKIDEPYCTGCQACERACPVDCMTVTMRDNPLFKSGESKRRKIVDTFWIDYGRCMRCNICIEVCNCRCDRDEQYVERHRALGVRPAGARDGSG